MHIKHIIIGISAVAATYASVAQDFHLSQYDAAPMYFNPAETGVFTGLLSEKSDYRFAAGYRSQWRMLTTKPFTTANLAFDMPYKRFGIGGFLLNNRSGMGNFNSLHFLASGAYHVIKQEENTPHILTTGIQIGFFSKSFNPNRFTFDNQYTANGFDNNISNEEDFDRLGKINFDVNAGFYYKYNDENNKAKPFIGGSIYHINRPNESFYNYGTKVPMRFATTIGSEVKLSEKTTVQPQVLYMYESAATEMNVGVLGTYLFKESINLIYGINYRLQDACIMQLGVKYDNVVFRLSYDYNTSYLKRYTDGRGAYEFTLILYGKKGQPIIPRARI